jgi:hypothetical protein
MAMMRTKLGLSEKDILNSTWISLQMQMSDFPSYDYQKKDKSVKITSKEQADEILTKFKNRKK